MNNMTNYQGQTFLCDRQQRWNSNLSYAGRCISRLGVVLSLLTTPGSNSDRTACAVYASQPRAPR